VEAAVLLVLPAAVQFVVQFAAHVQDAALEHAAELLAAVVDTVLLSSSYLGKMI
jgi:type III secretory pathway component EscS